MVGRQVQFFDVEVVQVFYVLNVVSVQGEHSQVHVVAQTFNFRDKVVVQIQMLQILVLVGVLNSCDRVS